MTLFSVSGVNETDGQTHVQICLGTEDSDEPDVAPYFLTITIAGDSASGKSGRAAAERHRLPLQRRDLSNLRRWLSQVLAEG